MLESCDFRCRLSTTHERESIWANKKTLKKETNTEYLYNTSKYLKKEKIQKKICLIFVYKKLYFEIN